LNGQVLRQVPEGGGNRHVVLKGRTLYTMF
jgi:hypothetical protein